MDHERLLFVFTVTNYSKEYKMRTKSLILTLLVLSAVVLSACAGVALAQTPATNSDDTTNKPQRTLSVNGTGKVYLTPDIVYLSIGVHTEGKNAAEAVDENTSLTTRVANAIKAFKIDEKDIQTSNFNISPQQQFDPNGKPTGITYMVDNTVYVTLRDLSQIGDLLDTVVKAGANNVYGITFDVADREPALSEARKLAVASARKQAEELTLAGGVTLGEVQTISSYSGSFPVPVYEGKGGGMMSTASSVPISPGQLVLTVDVSIIYEIR